MSFLNTSGNSPGFTAAQESHEAEILFAGAEGLQLATLAPATLSSTTVDSGNTPTTTIRKGMALGYNDSSGELQPYGAPSTDDGRDAFIGILPHTQNMLQLDTATDRKVPVLTSGRVYRDQLVGLNAQARAVMARRGFVFDQLEAEGAAFLVAAKRTIRKDDDFTVLASQNGCLFVQTGADKTFTLPTIEVGLTFEFLNASSAAVDDTMIIAATGAIMFGGSLAANSVTSAAPGGFCRVRAVQIGTSTVKWMVETHGSWS